MVIDGRVVFSGGADGDLELAAGSAVTFPGGLTHSVRGVDDSAFVLAISRTHAANGEG